MSNHKPKPDSNPSNIYHIRVKEGLGGQWQDWFEGMEITQDATGESVITGEILDQAQLFGLLKRVRNLGLTLISINRENPEDSQHNTGENE